MKSPPSENQPLVPFVKIITREAPLIGVESWYEGITNETECFFGFPFPENLFLFTKGTVECYRDSKRMEEIPFGLAKWIEGNEARLPETYERQKAALETRADIRQWPLATTQEALDALRRMEASFVQGFPGIVTTYLLPLWQETTHLFSENVFNQCRKWRTETDPFFDRSIETILHIIHRLFELQGWDDVYTRYVSHSELLESLQSGKLNKNDLEKRRAIPFAYIDGQLIFENDLGKELSKRSYILPQDQTAVSQPGEIKGNPANVGMAKGKVKIVFNREELGKVEQGDILVAPMTTPCLASLESLASSEQKSRRRF